MNRRTFLAGLAGAVATAATGIALGRRKDDGSGALRVGVMANLTHAPLLAGLGSGRIAKALAPVPIESRVFRAGPRVTEALIGDAIDVGTTGPAPAVVHHARHCAGGSRGRGGLRILGGVSSGGASLVVSRRSRIRAAADLHGKTLAVTQIGTTQELALRAYLDQHALRDATAGGDVRVIAVAGATILAQMKDGELDGAWLPEPWATRVVRELDGVRFIDERDLWEGRRFATAVLVARADRANDPRVVRLGVALEEEVARALRDPATARAEAYAELGRRVGNPGKRADFDAAWDLVDFTTDPVPSSIEELCRRAKKLAIVPASASYEGLLPSALTTAR